MAGLFDRLRAALGDRYDLEDEIGAGGMARVFSARDKKHDRRVAVKVLKPELAASIGAERFLREIRFAAQLQHPHVLPLHDSGEAGGLLFYVMPYVDGESLRQRLDREGQLPVDDALQILRQVADALAYAHSMGVVHRDVKPENILLHEGHAVVSDFGVARAVDAVEARGITESGMSVGTPAYMSPEQASGNAHVDARSDVYSLATVFYEMLAGEPPYTGPTPQAILARQLSGEVRSLTPLRSVTPQLDQVLRRALARSPADRFATMGQFVYAVSAAVEGKRPPRRAQPRWLVPLTAAVLVAGLAGWWAVTRVGATPAATVVVLPFANIGDDPTTTQPFVDGLAEVLTSKLTQLEPFFGKPLWVIPASEIRGRAVRTADEARRQFGATLVVTGSVQRGADQLQVTLNLVDAVTLRQVGSTVIRGAIADLATWQDGVVNQLAELLDVQDRPAARRVAAAGGTSQAQAYDLYVQGRGYLQGSPSRANVDAAIERLERAIEQDSSYALAYAGLGEAYWTLYDNHASDTMLVRRAIAMSERALRLNDSLPPVWITLGLIHVGTGRYEEAVRDLRRALELDPYSSEAYRLLANAHGRAGRPDSAEATFRRAIELKPYEWRAHNSLGAFYYRQGRYEDAVQQFLRVAELNPMNILGYSNAGGIYFFLERWEDARRMFERTLEIEPTSRAYSNLGTLDFYEGRYESSARRFQQAIALQPENYLYWGNLGDAYAWAPNGKERSREAYTRALELAEAALRVNPNDPQVLSHVLDYRAALGRRAGAEEVLSRLLPRIGDDPELMFSVARVYEILGEREAALDWLGKALGSGYSRRVVERSPDLRALRADDRYRAMATRP